MVGWFDFQKQSEIQVKGPALFLGYVHGRNLDPRRDHDVSFSSTGDCGYLRDNLLFITGRRDLIVYSGGENIYPQRIEEKILDIDGIYVALLLIFQVPDMVIVLLPYSVKMQSAIFVIVV